MGVLAAFGLLARTDLRGVFVRRRVVHSECRHRPRARTRRGCRDTGRAGFALARAERLPPLLVFGCCALLFHLSNAPLLPLVGQKLAAAYKDVATAMMSACIIAAQLIMLPIAIAVGRNADRVGRKPILLIGFAVLPIRAVLYTFSDQTWWLIGVQLLDGVGAGIFGAITPLVIADLMHGTGRFNAAQGAVATLQGIGAASSGLIAGVIVDHAGYPAAFLAAAVIASIALAALMLLMPETTSSRGAKCIRQSWSDRRCGAKPGSPCENLPANARGRRGAVRADGTGNAMSVLKASPNSASPSVITALASSVRPICPSAAIRVL